MPSKSKKINTNFKKSTKIKQLGGGNRSMTEMIKWVTMIQGRVLTLDAQVQTLEAIENRVQTLEAKVSTLEESSNSE